MDGTGKLFDPFIRLLPQGTSQEKLQTVVINYPVDVRLTYEQLAVRVFAQLPAAKPFVIVAESFSGPVALLLAEKCGGNLRAVVLVSSFVRQPLSSLGTWIARLPWTLMFRLRPPLWILRWLLMDSTTPSTLVREVREAIASVQPDVLAARLRDALRVDCAKVAHDCPARIVCLTAQKDRLLPRRNQMPPAAQVLPVSGPHLLLQCVPEAAVKAMQGAGLFAL